MKKFLIAAGMIATGYAFTGCGGAKGDDPGRSYAPDMYYSRAYEAYGYNNVHGEHDSLRARGINYSGMPVPGSVARGEMASYHLTNDSAGLQAANGIRNPLDSLSVSKKGMAEAERLYLINCGICHGDKLDGNGPLFNGGNGPYAAAPRNLLDDYTKALTDGHMYHVITFGIRTMGSYASQLNPEQRWWVISYIRSKQGGAKAAAPAAAATGTTATGAGGTATDSTNMQ